MITTNPKTLSGAQADNLREWLNQPVAREYIQFLRGLAAERTAQAGNDLMSGNESDRVDAMDAARTAKTYREFIELLQTHAAQDYQFTVFELQPTQ